MPVLVCHWHTQILTYLLTHRFLLHLAIFNISQNDSQQSMSLNMYSVVSKCKQGTLVIETDIVRAEGWLIPSGAVSELVPL